MSSTSTLSQSPAVFPQRSVCHMTICCALLRSLVHFDVDKRGRRAYNTWDEGRKRTQANSNQKAPIRPSTARAPSGQLTRRVQKRLQLTRRVQKRLGSSSFLRPKPHPNQPGWAGGFKKRLPTTLQHGNGIPWNAQLLTL